MARTFVQPGETLTWLNETGGDVAAGAVVVLGDCVAVAEVDIADDASGSVRVTGVHMLPKVAGTAWALGDKLDYDITAEAFTKGLSAETGDVTACAFAAAAAASGLTSAAVKLENPGAIN